MRHVAAPQMDTERPTFAKSWNACSKYADHSRLNVIGRTRMTIQRAQKIFTSMMNDIFTQAPKCTRKVAIASVWIANHLVLIVCSIS